MSASRAFGPPSPRAALLLTALAVGLVAVMGRLLDDALGGVSALHPTAGVAVGAALAWGGPAVAGAVLGALVGQLAVGGAAALPMALAGAAVVGAQGALARLLMARLGAWPVRLAEPREVVGFFVLLVPVVAGLGALAALVWGEPQAAPGRGTVTLAWVADALGIAAITPLVLSWIGNPAEDWRPRRLTVGLPLALAVVALAVGLRLLGHWNDERSASAFDREARSAAGTFEQRLRRPLDALQAIWGLHAASESVTAAELARASAFWLAGDPALRALGEGVWMRRDQMGAFALAQQREGAPGFKAFDRADRPGGPLPPDAPAMVVRHIEPLDTNRQALGVNQLSVPAARDAIERARRVDRAVASAAFQLTQSPEGDHGVVVYRVLYGGTPKDEAQRLAATRGVVFATLEPQQVARAAQAWLPPSFAACVLDRTPGATVTTLAATRPDCPPAASGAATHRHAFEFAGRDWEILITGEPAGLVPNQLGNTLLFAIVGLAGVSMLGVMMLLVTGRTLRIQAAVGLRTAQLQREVMERERTEGALRESELRLRQIFEAVPIGLVYTDRDGHIRQFNPAFRELTGFDDEALSAMRIHDLLHPDERGDAPEPDADGVQDPREQGVHRWVRRNGEVRWVQLLSQPTPAVTGQAARVVRVVADVTERLRLEDAERARQRAEASDRAKSDFVSRMSHELRTPLNAMLGFAQLLDVDRSQPLTDVQRQWAGQIQRAGWHLLDMINDTLDLSRIESGHVALSLQPLDLSDALGAALALVEQAALKQQVHTEVVDPGTVPVAQGDPTRVRQVLTNLLSNAVKYNRPGGRVAVTMGATDTQVWLRVADTGLGMTERQLAGLFQPFNRLGRERSTIEGTGIGLVISRRLAELMGGSLEASSAPGEGSVFTLTLPRASEAPPQAAADPAETAGDAQYRRRRVLYIEDNETNAEVMRGLLSQRPQVLLEVADTGGAGLRAARDDPPALLLLDMNLPDLDGLEVLRRLMDDPVTESVPVVLVSADATPARMQSALQAGAVRYLTKPVSVSELLGVVDELLEGRDSRLGGFQ